MKIGHFFCHLCQTLEFGLRHVIAWTIENFLPMSDPLNARRFIDVRLYGKTDGLVFAPQLCLPRHLAKWRVCCSMACLLSAVLRPLAFGSLLSGIFQPRELISFCQNIAYDETEIFWANFLGSLPRTFEEVAPRRSEEQALLQ
jgi:hypothetical protein